MEPRRRRRAMARRLMVSVALALACGIGAWINTSTFAKEEGSASGSRSSQASKASGGEERKAEAKLDEILENQQKILQRLDEVMEELRIVKIRATLR